MFKERSYTNKKKSVTLIEVLISAVFLTIIFIGIIFVFTKCIMLNEHNRNLTIATMHAQYIMEDIKNTNFSSILEKINDGDWNWGNTEISAEGLSPLKDEAIATIVGGADLLDITINVTWNDLKERLNEAAELPSMQIQTYLTVP